jgi:hypothetical protein
MVVLQEMQGKLEKHLLAQGGLTGATDLELEECVRGLVELKEKAKELKDMNVTHNSAVMERNILDNLIKRVDQFIKISILFKKEWEEDQEEEEYF